MSSTADGPDFERFFLASPDLMAISDARGYFHLVNPAFTEVLGWDRDELTNVPFISFVHPDDVERTLDEFAGQLRGERLLDAENRYRCRDGTYRRIQWRETGLEGGLMYSVGRDVTTRREAEAALIESEAKARSVLDTAMTGILTIDGEGRIEEFNPAAEKMFGWRADEVIGRNVSMLMPDDIGARHDGYIARYRETGDAHIIGTLREVEGRRKDGTLFPLELAVSEVAVEERWIFTGVVRDLTQREAVLRQIQEARAAAEEANQEKSSFLSRMSHELRTPLNAILGFAQLMELDAHSPAQAESTSMIMTAGRHLLELINEVLDISRIEAGELSLSLEPTALGDAIAECLAVVAPLANERGATITSDGTDDLYVLADARRLKQILLNLLSNAIKYGRAAGEIVIGVSAASDGRIRVTVTDDGPGIPADSMRRLFTPFERLGANMGEVEGTGLGLALSKRLVEAMEGSIGASSVPGEGSTFWFELAKARPPRARTTGGAADETSEPAAAAHGTLLYIEDQISNLMLMDRILQRRPGVRLLSATEGRTGFDLAREYQPTLILLDLHLPDMGGDEVLALLHGAPATRRIPVVVVTADAASSQTGWLVRRGADRVITKPLDVNEVLTLVDDYFREP